MENTHKSLQNNWLQRKGERESRKVFIEKHVWNEEGLKLDTSNGGEEGIDRIRYWLSAMGGGQLERAIEEHAHEF